MYSEIWFTSPGIKHPCFLVSGLAEATAERIVEALNQEFPECNFWEE